MNDADKASREANARLATPFSEVRGTKNRAEALVREYQRLNDALRESRIVSDHSDDPSVVAYERMIQARIEKQLILLDAVVV